MPRDLKADAAYLEEVVPAVDPSYYMRGPVYCEVLAIASEAIQRAMAAERRVEELETAIARAIDALLQHDHEDNYGPYGLADTRCIVHDGKLCDILYDLQAVLDKGEEG